jgi:hypothetical protein
MKSGDTALLSSGNALCKNDKSAQPGIAIFAKLFRRQIHGEQGFETKRGVVWHHEHSANRQV